jgi:predicted nucleic acid-binding Zn ribbon protein
VTGPGAEMPVGRAIDAWLAASGLDALSRFAAVRGCWGSVVGERVAGHVRPSGLRDEELNVEVDDPTWATEVAFLAPQLLEALSHHLGYEVAKRLKVHVRGRFGVD